MLPIFMQKTAFWQYLCLAFVINQNKDRLEIAIAILVIGVNYL